MASKLRIEFLRLRQRNSEGPQNILDVSNVPPVTKAVTGVALTGAGRALCPATVNGQTSYHVRLISDVECIVSFAPPGDAGTSYDASAAEETGIWIPANGPGVLVPVVGGTLISAATGLAFA